MQKYRTPLLTLDPHATAGGGLKEVYLAADVDTELSQAASAVEAKGVEIIGLKERIAELEKSLSVAVELFQDQSGDPVNEPDAYAWLQQANELMVR